MSGTNSSQGGLTRRSFLKTTGAVAGAAALAGGTNLTALAAEDAAEQAAAGEQTFRSACRGNCGSKCPAVVKVREGKVVSVVPNELPGDDAHRRRFCVKGFSQPQRLYDADRLKYPMKRIEGTERGAAEWERISWDDAIALAAEKIGAAVAEYGGTSVAFWSSYGSYGILNGALGGYMSVAYGRMSTILGATILGAGADNAQIYEQMTLLANTGNDFSDAANAKTIVSWGGNPAEAYVHAWQYVCDAREKGAKLITIDPQFTASAMHSDVYVPIIPGTDGAMMLAMTNWIIENDSIDRDFMKSSTVSPFLVKEDGTYLRMSDLGVEPTEGPISATTGQPTTIDPVVVWDESTGAHCALESAIDPAIEGSFTVEGFAVKPVFEVVKEKTSEYTVEKASEICGVSSEMIVELAKAYAMEGPVYTMTFQGLGHHVNSHHNYKNLAFLHAITGNAGKPGASVCGNPSAGSYPLNYVAFMMGRTGASMCGMHLPRLMEEREWAGEPIDIRVLWCHNGNMLSCESGRQELIEAVKKVDFVICADVSMTDTAQWADLILPVTHVYESVDFDSVCATPYPTFFEKAVEPLYECKSDLDIMRSLATALQMDFLYAGSDEDLMRAAMDTEMNLSMGAGYDAFAEGLTRTYVFNDVAAYGSDESTRFKYYLETPAPRNNYGQEVADYEKYPYFELPNESYMDNPLREKYPLMGCSQHDKYHVHSQLSYTPVIRELDPVPQLKINAMDAAERGIEQGDLVKAYNDRGYVVIKALVTEGIKPGVVSIPHGWQADQYIDGHAQDLTSCYMNDFCSNSAFYDFLCEVEKYEEA